MYSIIETILYRYFKNHDLNLMWTVLFFIFHILYTNYFYAEQTHKTIPVKFYANVNITHYTNSISYLYFIRIWRVFTELEIYFYWCECRIQNMRPISIALSHSSKLPYDRFLLLTDLSNPLFKRITWFEWYYYCIKFSIVFFLCVNNYATCNIRFTNQNTII